MISETKIPNRQKLKDKSELIEMFELGKRIDLYGRGNARI
jgi:hypothetical protein